MSKSKKTKEEEKNIEKDNILAIIGLGLFIISFILLFLSIWTFDVKDSVLSMKFLLSFAICFGAGCIAGQILIDSEKGEEHG